VHREKTNLYTVVVQNSITGTGIPVAFLLSRSKDGKTLANWLKALTNFLRTRSQTETRYSPNVAIVDQGASERYAIQTVFPEAAVLLCCFHVYKAIREKLPEHLQLMDGSKKEICLTDNKVREDIKNDVIEDVSHKILSSSDRQEEV